MPRKAVKKYTKLLLKEIRKAAWPNYAVPNLDLIKDHLVKGADPLMPETLLFSSGAFTLSAEDDHLNPVFKMMLDMGIDPQTRFKNGDTILHLMACRENVLENMRTILSFCPSFYTCAMTMMKHLCSLSAHTIMLSKI